MSKTGSQFIVDTQPTKEVVVSGLTKDASVEACIFDLIDNSIDAARERLLEEDPQEGISMPDDFSFFEIKLNISGDGVSIADNCGGIPIAALRDMVLRFGKPSSQALGIGVYGVGLNRAIFKLGRLSTLQTDTGKARAELTLNVSEYLKDDKNWGLPALQVPSQGIVGTELAISQPPTEIEELIADETFISELKNDISRRYSKFLDRGLTLILNTDHVVGNVVNMRENGPFPIEKKFYKTKNGVSILFQVGDHEDHRFKGEPNYNQEENKSLTPEYGWTIYCNDRAIVVSDTTRLTGWDTRFHSEFYGFVGTVNFLSEDPSLLPWNTTKTDLDLNNAAYKLALEDMRRFAERWRSFTARFKRERKDSKPLAIPPQPAADVKKSQTTAAGQGPVANAPAPASTSNLTAMPKAIKPKEGHNDLRYVLPDDINEFHCQDKFLEIVREAKALDVGTMPYASLAVIRMLFEFSLTHFMNREKRGKELIEFVVKKREDKSGKKITNPSSVSPKLEETLAFLDENPEIWGPLAASHIKKSVTRLKGYVPVINGALHNPFQAIHRSKVFQIRDEALAGLRYLIEHPLP